MPCPLLADDLPSLAFPIWRTRKWPKTSLTKRLRISSSKHFLFIPLCFCGRTCEWRYTPDRSGCSATTDQVDDQDHDGNNQQNVDQAARYVQAESKQPQNQENYQNCPEHMLLLKAWLRALDVEVRRKGSYSLTPGDHPGTAALPSAGLGVVERYCILQLNPAEQQQNNHNDEDQTQPAAREVAPGTA